MDNGPIDWRNATLNDDQPEDLMPDASVQPFLTVLHGNDLGRHFPLDKPLLKLGRAEQADIILDDDRSSGIHCQIRLTSDGIHVDDANSRNGTYVDDQRIQTVKLLPHSQIRVGRTVLRVVYMTAAEINAQERLFLAATTDTLTRVANRRWFYERARAELAFALRYSCPVCVVMLDIDHFKKINDTYGHPAGDHILVTVAGLLQAQKRQEDLLCRFGGEEFLFLFRQMKLEDAVVFCERIRQKIADYKFAFGPNRIPVTVSIGVSSFRSSDTLDSVISQADKALYEAKQLGRNRVAVAASLRRTDSQKQVTVTSPSPLAPESQT